MFTCSACLRRAIRDLSSDVPLLSFHSAQSKLSPLSCSSRSFNSVRKNKSHVSAPTSVRFSLHRRTHTSLASLTRSHHRKLYKQVLQRKTKGEGTILGNKRRQSPWALTRGEKRDALARERNRTMMLKRDQPQEDEAEEDDEEVHEIEQAASPRRQTSQVPHVSSGGKANALTEQAAQRKAIRKATKEVETYYRDPLQLAHGVINRLRVPDIEGALSLVRASEALNIDNIVSWNHCVDWMMAQGDAKGALRIYHEMKKRGQKPDAHTYTIMLRGFSRHVGRKPKDVAEAVKVYNSIFAPNSNVQPNTIHTNAIINVCARGGDMDALWAVAGRLPEFGPGCPDRWTYTTILNAIRENVIREAAKLTDTIKTESDRKEAEQNRSVLLEQAVADGRRIWEDVNWRWRRADLVMDEQLVCAMGRLLVGCGKPKDAEQVYDLIDQTMNLQVPGRKGAAAKTAGWLQLRDSERDETDMESQSEPSVVPEPFEIENKKSKGSSLPLKESVVYAKPGRNTLSLILETSANQTASSLSQAKAYWQLITDSQGRYAVAPDAQNIVAYIRVLRRHRASREIYTLLDRSWPDDVAQQLYRRPTFIIAFSTCLRDKNNPNVFDTARKLLKLMEDKLEENALGLFDRNLAVAELKTGKQKKKASKELALADRKAVFAADDGEGFDKIELELQRRKEGVQSLKVDPKALRMFVELGCATTPGWNEGVRGKDDGEVFERDSEKNNAIIALRLAAPQVNGLKRLVQLKLEETQFERNLPTSSRGRWSRLERGQRGGSSVDWDPRTGSRVGERLEDLIELMKTLVSTYDRVLTVAERFEMDGRTPISKKVRKDLDDRKRQFTAYMAKIETNLLKQMQDRQAFDEEGTNDEEGEQKPKIERQLQGIYDDVDRQILDSRASKRDQRTQKKGFKHAQLDNATGGIQTPEIKSRRQAKERENLLNARMKQQFLTSDYGVLDENLEIREGQQEKLRLQGQEWRARMQMPSSFNESISANNEIRDTWRKQQQHAAAAHA